MRVLVSGLLAGGIAACLAGWTMRNLLFGVSAFDGINVCGPAILLRKLLADFLVGEHVEPTLAEDEKLVGKSIRRVFTRRFRHLP